MFCSGALPRSVSSSTLKWAVGGWSFFIVENVVVSHNRAFLQACCTELWVLDGNGLDCREGAFDDQFASYASDVLGTGGAGAAATAMGNASRKARALDAAAAKGRRKGPKAGGAAQRTALM